MSIRTLSATVVATLCTLGSAWAQDFPEGATTPTAAELKQRLGSNVFSVKLADGSSWRLEFKSTGYFWVDTSGGFRGTGEWTAEDGKICSQLRGRDRNCNEVRIHQNLLTLKRDSGEIVQYVPR